MRIIIVEDDKRTASFVIKGLKQAGFAVDHASDGESSLSMLLNESYDVAVVDIIRFWTA